MFGSAFGQQATQQQQPQSSGGGLFGSTQQQPAQPAQSGGGLFGGQQQQTNTGGGGLFGGQQQQNQAPSGGLFGQQQPQQQQGGGLFGGQQQQKPAGSLFGAAPATGGGLFGGQQQQQPQNTQGGGLFGNLGQSTANTGGGLFGQTQQGQQQSGGGGLFGGQQGGGGLFANQQQQQQPQQGGGGLFGGMQQQQQGQQPGGLYGLAQSGGIFAGQQPGNSLFGGNQQGAMGGLYGVGANQNSMMMQSQQQQGPNVIVEKIQRVKNAWDPNHPEYAFKYYLYNQVGEDRAVHYVKPPNEDLAEWEKAWAERPNKGSVPVLANGFFDLDKRVKIQENQVNVFRHRLHEIQSKLTALQSRHDLVTSIKQEDCRRRHVALARRALSLAAKVQVLKNRGYALQTDEELLKKRLEGLARQVGDPAVRGRVNEIWARMLVVSEQARKMEESVGKVEIVWDQKQLETAGRLLSSNANGLEHLTKEVKEIEKSFAAWEEEQKTHPRGF